MVHLFKDGRSLTCLYSSRVMVPSLSVSCMLNKTAERTKNIVNQASAQQQACVFSQGDAHLSFSLLMRSRCSSVMCSDGGLKWDMTSRNSAKPISSTVPSPFSRKFLGTKRKQSDALTFHPPPARSSLASPERGKFRPPYLLSKKASMICERMGLHARS